MSSDRAQTRLMESRHGLHNISTDIHTVTFGEHARKQTRGGIDGRLLRKTITRVCGSANPGRYKDTIRTELAGGHNKAVTEKPDYNGW